MVLIWQVASHGKQGQYQLHGPYQTMSLHSLIRAFVITKSCLYIFDHLKPHFHLVKLGFTAVYIISLIFAQKHILLVLVRTASQRQS